MYLRRSGTLGLGSLDLNTPQMGRQDAEKEHSHYEASVQHRNHLIPPQL